MQKPELKAGDVFCTENPGVLGKAINFMQKLTASDDESVYSHAGIVTSMDGKTFEALWTIRPDHLSNRKGQKVLIARPLFKDLSNNRITEFDKKLALTQIIKKYINWVYPVWRLPLHIVPFMAKYVSAHGRFLVCSELVGLYLYKIGARHEHFTGTSPDDLADEFKHYRNYEVIYEGIW
jgi:hypothetical protein